MWLLRDQQLEVVMIMLASKNVLLPVSVLLTVEVQKKLDRGTWVIGLRKYISVGFSAFKDLERCKDMIVKFFVSEKVGN